MISPPLERTAARAILHLVVREVNALHGVISDGLRSVATIRVWRALPRPAAITAGAVMVVDLSDPPLDVHPRDLLPALNRMDLWLVLGKRSVDPAWLEVVQHPRVNVIANPSALVTELRERLRGPTGLPIATMVLEKEPGLRRLERYVHAICVAPWHVRRPRDLAVHAGEALRSVKERCRAEGFRRVEHFIVCVRAIAFEQLRNRLGMTIAAARAQVGFQDPSNMRRHIGRALHHSPQAAERFYHLMAV